MIELDLGSGVTIRLTTCSHASDDGATGGIVCFHDMEPSCDGSISWCPECGNQWQLISLDPLEISPSVACSKHPVQHHGYIRGGKWVKI